MSESNGNGTTPPENVYEMYQKLDTKKRFTRQPVLVEFPSGAVALLRPVGLDLLLKSGRVPDFLTPMIVDAMNGREPTQPSVDAAQQATDFVKFLDAMCELAFVRPKVTDHPQGEEEISPDDVDLGDKFFVYQMLGKPRPWLATFSPQQAGTLVAVDAVQSLPVAAEPAPEPETAPEG